MPIRRLFARISRLLLLTLTLAATQHSAASDRLPPALQLALDNARIPAESVSVWVQPVDAAAPTIAFNARTPMNPASVMKLVTAFAALERLGPAHTWRTRVATHGPIRNGVLEGDLFLVGGGDPVLGYDRVWKLLRRLRALGVAQQALLVEQGLGFVVRSVRADYLAPARLDDALEVSARIASRRRASLVFDHEIRRDGELLFTAQVLVACVDTRRLKPAALPASLHALLESQA